MDLAVGVAAEEVEDEGDLATGEVTATTVMVVDGVEEVVGVVEGVEAEEDMVEVAAVVEEEAQINLISLLPVVTGLALIQSESPLY